MKYLALANQQRSDRRAMSTGNIAAGTAVLVNGYTREHRMSALDAAIDQSNLRARRGGHAVAGGGSHRQRTSADYALPAFEIDMIEIVDPFGIGLAQPLQGASRRHSLWSLQHDEGHIETLQGTRPADAESGRARLIERSLRR